MDLSIAVITSLGFVNVPNKPKKTFIRATDNIILYEFSEPIWLVQLNGTVGEFVNLMVVVTEEDLKNAINGRNSK